MSDRCRNCSRAPVFKALLCFLRQLVCNAHRISIFKMWSSGCLFWKTPKIATYSIFQSGSTEGRVQDNRRGTFARFRESRIDIGWTHSRTENGKNGVASNVCVCCTTSKGKNTRPNGVKSSVSTRLWHEVLCVFFWVQMKFQRAARTDKGVSAVGQVCSLMISICVFAWMSIGREEKNNAVITENFLFALQFSIRFLFTHVHRNRTSCRKNQRSSAARDPSSWWDRTQLRAQCSISTSHETCLLVDNVVRFSPTWTLVLGLFRNSKSDQRFWREGSLWLPNIQLLTANVCFLPCGRGTNQIHCLHSIDLLEPMCMFGMSCKLFVFISARFGDLSHRWYNALVNICCNSGAILAFLQEWIPDLAWKRISAIFQTKSWRGWMKCCVCTKEHTGFTTSQRESKWTFCN